MGFKDTSPEFRQVELAQIDPNPQHPRREIDAASLKGLVASIGKKGLIHPLIVQPADADGRYRLIVGERRRQAALLAGETSVPVLIRACGDDEALEIQVFENLGLGVRLALEPRDMANAIEQIARRFDSEAEAAEQFGRSPQWLNQATAAARLSPKVSQLLDRGKIASTTTAVRIDKLARKDEARAERLIDRIEKLPEGEKLPRQIVDEALSEAGVLRRKKTPETPAAAESGSPGETPAMPEVMPWEDLPVPGEAAAPAEAVAAPSAVSEPVALNRARHRVSPGKVRQVAEILGLGEEDEAAILERLIDEFLASRGETGA